MNTFVVGQRVRITEAYGKDCPIQDGSFAELHGTEGTVTGPVNEYTEVAMDAKDGYNKYLFLPEELEAV